jgi:hypothetical protein
LSEKRDSLLRLLKNKSFKEESMTKVGLDAIGKSTTLESNKSLYKLNSAIERGTKPDAVGRRPYHWTSTLKAGMVNARRA